jgi:hypothetical protein
LPSRLRIGEVAAGDIGDMMLFILQYFAVEARDVKCQLKCSFSAADAAAKTTEGFRKKVPLSDPILDLRV